MTSLKGFAFAGFAGVLCLSFLRFLHLAEWATQLTWLALVLLGSTLCGYLVPTRAWLWGAVLIGVQPLCVWAHFWFAGELERPSSSTGGMVAVFIFAVLSSFIIPFAMIASFLGGMIRQKFSGDTIESRRFHG